MGVWGARCKDVAGSQGTSSCMVCGCCNGTCLRCIGRANMSVMLVLCTNITGMSMLVMFQLHPTLEKEEPQGRKSVQPFRSRLSPEVARMSDIPCPIFQVLREQKMIARGTWQLGFFHGITVLLLYCLLRHHRWMVFSCVF